MPKRPNILVIDDSKAVRLLAIKALAPYACDVHEATNGFTGLFAMERTSPDLLLVDVNMPTMDGVEMLTMIKSHAELKLIPVIMLASTTDHKVLPKITALGVDAVLKKPLSPVDLVQAVLRLCKLKPA